MIQSSWTLSEAMAKKGRCPEASGNGPLTFPRQLDVVADAAIYALTHDAGSCSPEVWGKSETSEHNPIFGNKTVGCKGVKPGLIDRP